MTPSSARASWSDDLAGRNERLDSSNSDQSKGGRQGHSYAALRVDGHAHVQLGDHHQHFYQGNAPYRKVKDTYTAQCDHEDQPDEEDPKATAEARRDAKLVKSLAFPQMEARQHNIDTAMPRTCEWLFEHNDYLSWIDEGKTPDHHGFLWIKGKPGCGKSTIMKQALGNARRDQSRNLILSYFFNARATSMLEKSPLGLYRSVINQMLTDLPQFRRSFIEKFAWKIERYSDIEWSKGELEEFLIEIIRTPFQPRLRLSLFVDALDEGDQSDVRRMVAFIEDFTQHAIESSSGNMVRVCFSSRHYPRITIKKGILMNLEDQAGHKEDIRKYINEKLVIEESALAESLGKAISRKSRHVFLWVVLVIPILNALHDSGGTSSKLMSHLETLPDELHGLFKELVLKDCSTMDQSAVLFQLVLFSFRPLTPVELYVGVHIGAKTPLDLAQSTEASRERFILQCSRGLVEIVTLALTSKSEIKVYKVQFIHESVREFLIQRAELVQLRPDLTGNIRGLSHDSLKQICIDRIRQYARLGLSPSVLDSAPPFSAPRFYNQDLLNYAFRFVFKHAVVAEECGVSRAGFVTSFYEQHDNYDLQHLWRTFTEDGKRLWDCTTSTLIFADHTMENNVAKAFVRIAVAAPDWLTDSYVMAYQSAFLEWFVSSWLCIELRMDRMDTTRPLSAYVAASLPRADLSQVESGMILSKIPVGQSVISKGGCIAFRRTSDLCKHLTLDNSEFLELNIFQPEHRLQQLEGPIETELFPPGFIKEASRTLTFLRPLLVSLLEDQQPEMIKPKASEISGNLKVPQQLVSDFRIESYPYFASRLLELQRRCVKLADEHRI